MDTYPTFAALIDELGGSSGLAEITGKPIGTTSAMKTRGVIPPAYWDAVVQAARRVGLTGVSHELLAKLYASRRERAAEDAAEARA